MSMKCLPCTRYNIRALNTTNPTYHDKITVDADSKAKFPTIFKNLKMRKLDKRHVNTPYSDKKKTPRLKRVRKITTYRERQWLSEEKLVIQIRDENKMMNK